MTKITSFGQRFAAFLLSRNPLLSYGELVLRPVTIAERVPGDIPAQGAGQNKT